MFYNAGRIVILAKKKTCGIWKGITAFDANRNEQRQERTKEEEVDDEQSFLGVVRYVINFKYISCP